jgi:L-threonylcarbamoyladenylate synthase
MAEISQNIVKAIELLDNHELVAIPTETVYGLAGNANSDDALLKIFSVKNRPKFNPLILHLSSLERAKQYVEYIPDLAYKLAEKFVPGPITFLLKKTSKVPDLVTAGSDLVAIRIPNHKLTLELLSKLDYPLCAPSANPFGYISPTNPNHVNEQLGDKIQLILDGGECNIGIESTIISLVDRPTIYRKGGVSIEQIEKVIGKVEIHKFIDENPVSPGNLKSHYSPNIPSLLGNIDELAKDFVGKRIGILNFNKINQKFDPKYQLVLAMDSSLETAAKNLFKYLRELDNFDVDVILLEEVPNIGLGLSINDRLRRAAKNT